jgi:hypothetical protein
LQALRGKYGEASEIFSFGLCLLELISGRQTTADTHGDVLDATGYSKDPMGLAKEWLDPQAGM